jgi:hypothetical protein
VETLCCGIPVQDCIEAAPRGAVRLEVPRFVKIKLVTSLDKIQREINLYNILLGCRIPPKYSNKIVAVKFSTLFAVPLHTEVQAKHFQAKEVKFSPIVAFKWCLLCPGVDKSIEEEHFVSKHQGHKNFTGRLEL